MYKHRIGAIRDIPPCKDCTEKYTACYDKCEKYKAWRAKIELVKKNRKDYEKRMFSDYYDYDA
jgi:hypothetical protein